MKRYELIILALGLCLCAYWLGYTNGRDHAYLQFAELEQNYPCDTDSDCEALCADIAEGAQK